jgi:hypothetical protein
VLSDGRVGSRVSLSCWFSTVEAEAEYLRADAV